MISRNAGASAVLATLAILISSGNSACAAPPGPVQLRADGVGEEASANTAHGSVHLIKKGKPGPKFGKSKPKFGQMKPWRRFGKRYHGHRIYRGRHFHDGVHWYFWAPWIGTYFYYESYDACYRWCRRQGYGHFYCNDLCTY